MGRWTGKEVEWLKAPASLFGTLIMFFPWGQIQLSEVGITHCGPYVVTMSVVRDSFASLQRRLGASCKSSSALPTLRSD